MLNCSGHWREKYTEVQSQQMTFTQSPSLCVLRYLPTIWFVHVMLRLYMIDLAGSERAANTQVRETYLVAALLNWLLVIGFVNPFTWQIPIRIWKNTAEKSAWWEINLRDQSIEQDKETINLQFSLHKLTLVLEHINQYFLIRTRACDSRRVRPSTDLFSPWATASTPSLRRRPSAAPTSPASPLSKFHLW